MKHFKDLREAVSPAQQAAIAIAKKEKGIKESPSKQIHVRMDNLGKDGKKVGDILRKYEKNGSIEFDGETDKGAIFTVKKPAAIATLNRELKPYYTSAQLGEAKKGEIKIVADTNTRKYKEGEVIKTFPETDKGLNQAMVFQKSVKDRYGVQTTMVRESVDEAVDPADKGEYDNEGEMAKTQLRGVVADASHMIKMFSDDQNLPEWVQAKITKAADYLKSAHSYMMNKDEKG
jgi:hypothetical protein